MVHAITTGYGPAEIPIRLAQCGATQRELAQAIDISPTALSLLINRNTWPQLRDRQSIIEGINHFFTRRGTASVQFVFPTRSRRTPGRPRYFDKPKEDIVLFRRFSISPNAKKTFKLFRDPFSDDAVAQPDDVYLSPSSRYALEAMLDTARNGGFRAVVGESGAGKTTLRQMLAERILVDREPIILIEPYVLGMEGSDVSGKTLKSGHIADAIIRTLSPNAVTSSNLERRFDVARRLLRDSMMAGNKHMLIIEEAHGMPTATLKHLKRWSELREGMRRLISILLIGQPELSVKLSANNKEVREVVQRCEICELEPLDADVERFIQYKFERVGAQAETIMDSSAYPEIINRLTYPGRDGRSRISYLYPLAVGNLVAGAINIAADLGLPAVNADVVRRV